MKRILLAMLLSAAPVLAHDRGRNHEDDRFDRESSRDDDDRYGGFQQDAQDESGYGYRGEAWQSWDDSAYADRGPSFDDFRNDAELSWNGEWIDTPEYGTVWRPRRVNDEWQPYVYGRWVWTRAGWAWASDEPFGWAVYHYGRWAWSPAFGWMWVPGRVWAPAWVSWRWTDGYAAWCPLGPRRVVQQPSLWVVVPSRHFLEPVRHHVVPRNQRPGLPLPPAPGPRAGPPITQIERATGRSVRPLAINDGATPGAARASSGTVTFYRPRTAPIAAPPRQGGARVIPGGVPQAPRATPQGPRSPWYGAAPSPTQQPPRVDSPAPPAVPAPRVVPHAGVPAEAPAPRAGTPRPLSSGEQPQAKER